MMGYKPTCLEEDLPRVLAARADYKQRVAILYNMHECLNRVSARARSPVLRKLAGDWLATAEMIVATDLDIVRFDAQIKRGRHLDIDVDGMCEIFLQVKERNDEATRDMDDVCAKLGAEWKRIDNGYEMRFNPLGKGAKVPVLEKKKNG